MLLGASSGRFECQGKEYCGRLYFSKIAATTCLSCMLFLQGDLGTPLTESWGLYPFHLKLDGTL